MYETEYFDAFKTTCANTLEENTNKKDASMCNTQSLDVYDMCKCTNAMKTYNGKCKYVRHPISRMAACLPDGWTPAECTHCPPSFRYFFHKSF